VAERQPKSAAESELWKATISATDVTTKAAQLAGSFRLKRADNTMPSYIGLIHKDANSDFGVSFPDFPGAITAGTTLDDARAMAEEALALHVEGMVEDGLPIPDPSRLEEILEDRIGTFILVAVG
jgi:predicted RNase H-like HicB family nuclease